MELVAVYIGVYKKLRNLLIPLNNSFDCTLINSDDKSIIRIRQQATLKEYYKGNNYSLILGQNGTGKTSIMEFLEGLFSTGKGEGMGIFYKDKGYFVSTNLLGNPSLDLDLEPKDFYFEPTKNIGLLSVNNVFDVNKFVFKGAPKNTGAFIKITDNEIVNKGRKRAFLEEVSGELTFFSENKSFMRSIGNPNPQFLFRLPFPKKTRFTNAAKEIENLANLLLPEMDDFINRYTNSPLLGVEPRLRNESRININDFSEVLAKKYPETDNSAPEHSEFTYLTKDIASRMFDKNIFISLSADDDELFWKLMAFFLSDFIWNAAQQLSEIKSERYYFYVAVLIYTFIDFSNIEEDGRQYVPEPLRELMENNSEPYDIIYKASSIVFEISSILSEEKIEFSATEDSVTFSTHDKTLISELTSRFNDLNSHLTQEVEFGWSGFSSGESALIKLFSRTFHGVKQLRKSEPTSILLLMDEVDLYLHPDWQRSFLTRLFSFINSIKRKNENIQVILTSHSPIIASDFLPDDIVTLVRNHNETVISETSTGFGASISQLYMDSFSLTSTIGEYSRELLSDLIRSVNAKNVNDFELKLLNRVGDELIKEKLLEYLNRD